MVFGYRDRSRKFSLVREFQGTLFARPMRHEVRMCESSPVARAQFVPYRMCKDGSLKFPIVGDAKGATGGGSSLQRMRRRASRNSLKTCVVCLPTLEIALEE